MAAVAGPGCPRLALPWQRLQEGPEAAGAPRSGPGSGSSARAVRRSAVSSAKGLLRLPKGEQRGLGSPSSGRSFRAAGAPQLGKGNFHRARNPCARSAEPRRVPAPAASPLLSRDRSFLPRSRRRGRLRALGKGAAYTGLSSRHRGSASLALGLRSANPPLTVAAADGAQRDPAAACASSITGGGYPKRAAQARPRRSAGSDWPGRSLHAQL